MSSKNNELYKNHFIKLGNFLFIYTIAELIVSGFLTFFFFKIGNYLSYIPLGKFYVNVGNEVLAIVVIFFIISIIWISMKSILFYTLAEVYNGVKSNKLFYSSIFLAISAMISIILILLEYPFYKKIVEDFNEFGRLRVTPNLLDQYHIILGVDIVVFFLELIAYGILIIYLYYDVYIEQGLKFANRAIIVGFPALVIAIISKLEFFILGGYNLESFILKAYETYLFAAPIAIYLYLLSQTFTKMARL